MEHLPAVTYREALVATPEDFYISPQVTEVFGYSPEEWTWTPRFWSERVHPDDRDRVFAVDQETNRTGSPYVAEYRFLKADGTYLWIHDESTLVRRPDGSGFRQGFMLDITERKEAENRLAETEQRYRLLVERSPLLIYVQEIDPDTGGSVTTYLSPANEALIGYTAEEVQADPALWTRLIHPDDRDRVRGADRATNVSGDDFSLEYRMLHRDGRTVWVQDVATLIESEDRRYWQGFMLDITERKEAEQKVARALTVERDATQLLRAVDEMKNTFLQAVSHDLRTPLAAILGLAITLERGDIGLESAEIHELAVPDRRERPQARPAGHRPVGSGPPRAGHRRAQAPPDGGERARRARGRRNGPRRRGSGEPGPAAGDRERRRRQGRADRREPARERVALHARGFDGVGSGPAGGRRRDDRRRRRGPRDRRGDARGRVRTLPSGAGRPRARPGRRGRPRAGGPVRRAHGRTRMGRTEPGGGASFRVHLADGPRTSAEVGTAG